VGAVALGAQAAPRFDGLTNIEQVTAMEFRVVKIADDFECYLLEPYAAYRLGTPYNSRAASQGRTVAFLPHARGESRWVPTVHGIR
jgi:hypothetical protein